MENKKYKIIIHSKEKLQPRLLGEFSSYGEAYEEAKECIPDGVTKNILTEDTDMLEKLVIVESYFKDNIQFFKSVYEWIAK